MSLSSLRRPARIEPPAAVRGFLRTHRHRMYTVLAGGLLAAAVVAPPLYRDYQAYMALGEGGLPHNVFGWALACAARLLARETLSTDEYAADADQRSWLAASEIPRRDGARPRTGAHPIPHRQVDQFAQDREIVQAIPEIFTTLASRNANVLELRRSVHERHTDALFVRAGVDAPHADAAWREIAHAHVAAENSLHVVLAPRDCKLVIERGWGERHGCSGRAKGLPKEYLLLYAPRNREELEVVVAIVRAACGYMTGKEIV